MFLELAFFFHECDTAGQSQSVSKDDPHKRAARAHLRRQLRTHARQPYIYIRFLPRELLWRWRDEASIEQGIKEQLARGSRIRMNKC